MSTHKSIPQPDYTHGNVVQIWDDLHTERSGYFRAFWCDDKGTGVGTSVIGYCSPGGSHRTIKATAQEVRKYFPKVKIYRNGKKVKL